LFFKGKTIFFGIIDQLSNERISNLGEK